MFKYYWYETLLPKSVCEEVCKVLKQSDTELKEAEVVGQEASHVRKSVNHWVPDSSWINGFCRHYIDLANDKNFKYDITQGLIMGRYNTHCTNLVIFTTGIQIHFLKMITVENYHSQFS